jgi:hypothetical protein
MPTIAVELDLESGITPSLQLYSVASRVTGASSGSAVTGTLVSGTSVRYVFSITANAGDYYAKISSSGTVIATACLRVTASSFDIDNDWPPIESRTLISTSGGVTVTNQSPVSATTAEINGPLFIGDDYLSANTRAFNWTISAPTGYTIGTSSCRFGGKKDGVGWLVTGTITDAGSGNWSMSFDLPKTATQDLEAGYYQWSVEVRDANGTEITRVKAKKNGVQLVEKQT